jgi:hypothetical protein
MLTLQGPAMNCVHRIARRSAEKIVGALRASRLARGIHVTISTFTLVYSAVRAVTVTTHSSTAEKTKAFGDDLPPVAYL